MPGLHRSAQPFSQAQSLAPKAVTQVWQSVRLTRRLCCHGPACAAFADNRSPTAVPRKSRTAPRASYASVRVFARDSLPSTACASDSRDNSNSQRHRPFAAGVNNVRLRSYVPIAPARLARPPAAIPELLASLAASPYRDYYVVASAAVGAAVWVKVFDLLAANGNLEQKLSRKLVHTTTGPLFILTWALFSAAPAARFLASVVPMLNFARLTAVGTGLVSDPGLVKSVSRSGDRGELLKGPLFYVVTLVAATVLCWRDDPAGLIAVAMMCGGDGLADIVGRRWGGSAKLPINKAKSWAGSIAMLVGGYGMSYGLVWLFCHLGFFACYSPAAMLSCLGAVALGATVVEALPINQYVDDNFSVPIAAAGLSMLLLPQPVDAVAATEVVMPMAGLAVSGTVAAATAAPSLLL